MENDASSFAKYCSWRSFVGTQEFVPSSAGASPVKCHSPNAARAAMPVAEAGAPAPEPAPMPAPVPTLAPQASPCKPPALDAGAANAEAAATPVRALYRIQLIPPIKSLAPGNADAHAGAPLLAALAGIEDVQVLGCDDVNLAAYRASTTGFGISPVSDFFSSIISAFDTAFVTSHRAQMVLSCWMLQIAVLAKTHRSPLVFVTSGMRRTRFRWADGIQPHAMIV